MRLPRRPIFRPAILALAGLAAVPVLLAACGDDDVEETPTTEPVPVTAESLAGRTFVSTAAANFDLVDGSTVRLAFDVDTLALSADCNTMGGPFRIEGATLIASELAMTEMACDPALMDQDGRLADLLASEPTLVLEGEVLVVSTPSASITFLDREVADPDRPLEATTWTLTALVTGDAVSSVPQGVTSTLSISGGTALVAAGCNTGSAPVTVGDGTLELGPLALTKMACADDAMQVESAVSSVLSGTVDYTIEADVLTITAADGTSGLQYSVVAG